MSIPVKRKRRTALTELPGDVHPGIRLNFHQLLERIDAMESQFLKTPGYKVGEGSGQSPPFAQQPVVPPVRPVSGNQEVFYQNTDPVVTYPAINFKTGYFPAHPTIPAMVVFKP